MKNKIDLEKILNNVDTDKSLFLLHLNLKI